MIRLVLLLATLAASPFAQSGEVVLTSPVIDFSACAKPSWPKESLAKEETGIVSLAFRINTNGQVVKSALLGSSGYTALDEAAIDAIVKCPFKPGMVNGAPHELWTFLIYQWSIEDAEGTNKALLKAFVDAEKGDIDAEFALFNFGVLKNGQPMSIPERMRWLRQAAEAGHPVAQYRLAGAYEVGRAIERNEEEAIGWYVKAANRGNVVAIEKVRLQWPQFYIAPVTEDSATRPQ